MQKLFAPILLLLASFTVAFPQKVGLIMGSHISDRWYLDQKLFSDRIKELGGECVIEIAYDHAEQVVLAEKLIKEGASVLAIVAYDGKRASEIVDIAMRSNVPVIAYDRLIHSPNLSLYITYHPKEVGRLQAEYAINKVPRGTYILVNGPVTDNNAIEYRSGQLEVLKPYVENKQITIIEDLVMDKWSEIEAFEKMNAYFVAEKETPAAILASNDAFANSIIKALPTSLHGKVLLTGQDADKVGIQNIIARNQAMTVYKPIKPLAYRAAEAAMEITRGIAIRGTSTTVIQGKAVQTILLNPQVVDLTNYKETVIADGQASLSEVVNNIGSSFELERNKSQMLLLRQEKQIQEELKENQKTLFIIIITFLTISSIGLGFTIIQKQRHNKLLNLQQKLIEEKNLVLNNNNETLQALNEELLVKQEEIAAQRDAISSQKEKLVETNQIIEKQRDEILHQKETLEYEVEKRTSELTQYTKHLEQYAFVTAHNLRAPVAQIIGLGTLLRKNMSDEEERNIIADRVIQASKELDLVIKELNAILNLRSSSKEAYTVTNLQDELIAVKQDLHLVIQESGATIEADFTHAPNLITIKPYLRSILFNLISNAIKYRDPARKPFIIIRTEIKDPGTLLSIVDNGLGIDLNNFSEKLFAPYTRFHLHVEGRGIGLFLVKNHIESVGGSIEVDSKPNEGTTFRIYFPQAKVPTNSARPS